MRIRFLVGVVAVLCLALTGCGGGPSAGAGAAGSAPEQRMLTVLAASSLTDSFDALGRKFEIDNPGVVVRFNYAGSADLAQQIVNGAPADVFAAASEVTMKTVTDAGLAADTPTVFATNVLQIATARGNPKHIASFADLARPGLAVVVAGPQVPCGAATKKVERATGVKLTPVSEESDVRSTLGKVMGGDADAAVVYVTDVVAANGKVQGIAFPEAAQAVTDYPITVVKNAPQAELAAKFKQLVTGEFGQKTLHAARFGTK